MLDPNMKTRSKGTVDNALRRKPPRGHPNRDLDQLTKRTATEVAKTPNEKERRTKTPKSKRKPITPLRDDLICSQQFDSQVVVGWDCHSPNSLRDLRKSHSEDDPTDLISRLMNDEPEEIISKRSTPPLLAMWRGSERDETEPNTLIPNRLKKRDRKRRKSAKDTVSQALLQKLEKALDKCSETNKETEPRNAEGEFFPSDIDEEGEDEEDELMVVNTSEDLFDLTANPASVLKGDTSKSPETVLKNNFNPKSICVPKDSKEKAAEAEEDEDWSDNDLFDDSFIIKPTQLSLETKKSQVFGLKRKPFRDSDLPQSKCFRASEKQAIGRPGLSVATSSASVTTGNNRLSAGGSKPSISSVDGKVGAYPCTRTRQLPTKSVPTATVSSSVASGSVSRASFVQTTAYKQQSPVTEKSSSSFYGKNKVSTYTHFESLSKPVSQSKPMSVMSTSVMRNNTGYKNSSTYTTQTGLQSNNSYGATGSKQAVNQSTPNRNSAFKKHSSFSGTESANQLRTLARKRSISGNSNSSICASTVTNAGSFQVRSAQNSNTPFHGQNKTSYSTYQKVSSSKPHTVTSSNNHVVSGNSKNTLKTSTRAPMLSSGAFDTSLSDDLLCQLAEPDDILDSQIEPTKRLNKPSSAAGGGSSVNTKPSVFSRSTNSSSMSVKTVKPEVPVARVAGVKTESSNTFSNKPTVDAATVGPAKQYRFRDSQKSGARKSPPQLPKPAQTPASTSKAQTAVSVGPVKSVQSESGKGGKMVSKTEDLFLDDFGDDAFDDEFSDDDCLTEPQILAMLDEAEFLATQQCASQKRNSDKIRNSQDQISNSQGSAGSNQGQTSSSQGHTSNSQGQVTNSEGHLSNSQGQGHIPNSPDHGSQGHVSASQTKYTAIDIERKKREALERKKQKTQLRNTQVS